MSILNKRELERNLALTWVEPNAPLGVAVTFGNINNPGRPLPFFELIVRGFKKLGRNYVSPPDDDGNVTHSGTREFVLEINAFGVTGADTDTTDAVDNLQNLVETLELESIRQALIVKSIFYVSNEEVLDISGLFGRDKIESRASVEILFRIPIPYGAAASNEDLTEIIETVDDPVGTYN